MNKKGQSMPDLGKTLEYLIAIFFAVILLGVAINYISNFNQDCPECDCSGYEENISKLEKNLTACKNKNPEIVYKNRTIEKEVPKPMGSPPLGFVVIEFGLIISLVFGLTLIKFNVRLPEKIEKKIEKYEKWIHWIKIASLVIAGLGLIRLVWILIKMF